MRDGAVQERDELGDLPPDYLTEVREGGFYGWPWSYIGKSRDPRLRPDAGAAAKVAKAIVPDVLVQAHSAVLDLEFYDGKISRPRTGATPSSPSTARGTGSGGRATS